MDPILQGKLEMICYRIDLVVKSASLGPVWRATPFVPQKRQGPVLGGCLHSGNDVGAPIVDGDGLWPTPSHSAGTTH